MTLKEKLPSIFAFIDSQRTRIAHNEKLLSMYNGEVKKYVHQKLVEEFSPDVVQRASSRIPPLNFIKQVVNKTSGVYAEPASRSLVKENKVDAEVLSNIENLAKIDTQLNYFTDMFILHGYASMEWYLKDNKPQLRIMNATEFIVYSDDKEDPSNMTVFIKFMGIIKKTRLDGKNLVEYDCPLYRLYTKDEYMEVDKEGQVYDEWEHNHGYLNQIYYKKGNLLLPPIEDDLFDMGVLLPLLISDVNYFSQFSTHSVMYGVDVNLPTDMVYGPDRFWNFTGVEKGEGTSASPHIGTIKPDADTNTLWASIEKQLIMWLESRGLQTKGAGDVSANNTSGIAKIIDESDATRVRKKLKTLLNEVEGDLWELLKKKMDIWVPSKEFISPNFSKDASITVDFAEEKPLHDFNSSLDSEEKLARMGLTTPKLSLTRLFPYLTSEEIDGMLVKIEEYKRANPPIVEEKPIEEEEEDGQED